MSAMNDDRALVTTVIPTYRRPILLQRAIRSALEQSMSRLVVAVYDNASGDETRKVVAELRNGDSRIQFESHPANIGSTANYNHGISRVETPFFSLAGDDDLLHPDFYDEAMQAFERYPEAVFFCARTLVEDRIERVIRHRSYGWKAGFYRPTLATTTRMILDHFINTGVVFRREIRDSVGLLDEFGSDRNYLVLAAARHPFVVSDRELAVFTVHQESFTGGETEGEFNPGQGSAWNSASIIGASRELERGVAECFDQDRSSVVSLTNAIRSQMRRDLLYACFVRSVPSGRLAEIPGLTDPSLGFAGWQRQIFRLVGHLGRNRFLAVVIHVITGVAKSALLRLQLMQGKASRGDVSDHLSMRRRSGREVVGPGSRT